MLEQFKKDEALKNADKVREFQWDNAEADIKGDILSVSDDDVQQCANLLVEYILNNIDNNHFSEMDNSGMRFVMPVDPNFHKLIQQRFDEKWSLDSRLEMFDEIRLILFLCFNKDNDDGRENREKLDVKIQEALPSSLRKKFVSGNVCIEDDAMVVGEESNMVSVEIPVNFAANK